MSDYTFDAIDQPAQSDKSDTINKPNISQQPPGVRYPEYAPAPRNLLGYFNTLLIMVVVAIVLLRSDGQHPLPPGPGPGPVPPPHVITEDVPAIIVAAEKKLAINEAQASEKIGQLVLSGEIGNSSQLRDRAKAYQQAVEDDAFAEVNKLNDKYLLETNGGWTDASRKVIDEFQKLKAEGKRRVAK